jgi:hypothetical protein
MSCGKRDVVNYLYFIRDFPQIHITPTRFRPVRQKWPSNTSVKHYEFAVAFVKIICCQNLSIGAKIKAVVWPFDVSNIIGFRDDGSYICPSIQDKNKVRGSMETMCYEELEVDPSGFGLGVCVENERSAVQVRMSFMGVLDRRQWRLDKDTRCSDRCIRFTPIFGVDYH